MFSPFNCRVGAYLLLTVAWAALCLPNLGVASLWDIDEGNNATCAAEMYQSGDFVLPTFNYKPRVDKPALLYWLQMAAYRLFGVNERSARLPSALATLVSLLAVYELGRQMFGASAGLLAGVVLGSTLGVSAAGHFANPDALLHACTLLTMLAFYRGYTASGGCTAGSCWWFGIWTGMGTLAKGPVAFVLPFTVCFSFLCWEWQLRRLGNWRLLLGFLGFIVVAVPWYVWVALETKGEWLAGFLLKHNIERALSTMENHRGQVWYYPAVLLIGFGLWSCFLWPTAWNAVRRLRGQAGADRSAVRFLLCWMGTYLVFFTIVQTKLPNYVLPLYPAGAILFACLLDNWQRGEAVIPGWFVPGSLSVLVLAGLLSSAGLLFAGGAIPVVSVSRSMPGLEKLAGLGLVPLVGAGVAAWCLGRRRRGGVVVTVCATAIVFTAGLAALLPATLDPYKAPRGLAASLPSGQLLREVRVATLEYSQPSLNFYCQREVTTLPDQDEALQFLQNPLEAYLFLPAETWQELAPWAPSSAHLLGRRHDLYRNCDVVVVANR